MCVKFSGTGDKKFHGVVVATPPPTAARMGEWPTTPLEHTEFLIHFPEDNECWRLDTVGHRDMFIRVVKADAAKKAAAPSVVSAPPSKRLRGRGPAGKKWNSHKGRRVGEGDDEPSAATAVTAVAAGGKGRGKPAGSYRGTACHICQRTTNSASMLLCDGCDRGYHMQCLSPTFTTIPRGGWFCDLPCCRLQSATQAWAKRFTVTKKSSSSSASRPKVLGEEEHNYQ